MLLADLDLTQEGTNPIAKFKTFSSILNLLLPLLTTAASLVFLAMLLKGAHGWLTSGDNPELLKKSQQTFIYAIIGLVVVVMSFLAVQLLGKVLGIDNLLRL